MKIAVVGAGHVGSALARLWAARRHDVTVGTRRDGRNDLPVAVRVSGVAEACIDAIGPQSGKIIVDATNPLLPDGSGLELGTTTSAAEEIAKKLPESKVVKAFNTIGSYLLGDADFGWLRADGYYCGDDAKAKRIVHSLIEDGGLEPVDTGPLRMARMLEPLAVLWINLLYRQGRPKDFAFKLLHREPGG
jgi:predicted dinucleotide-binding enzyme